MMSDLLKLPFAITVITVATLGAASAGGSGLDEDADQEQGTPFFGFVKDLNARGRGIPEAKVTAQVKGANVSLLTRSDAQGHFRIAGFSKDVDPDQVEINCAKEGYKLQRAARRKLSGDKGAPIEVDCLMTKE